MALDVHGMAAGQAESFHRPQARVALFPTYFDTGMATVWMKAGTGGGAHCALVFPIVRMTQTARTNMRPCHNDPAAAWFLLKAHGIQAGEDLYGTF